MDISNNNIPDLDFDIIKQNIKEVMKRQNITQNNLAKALGVKQSNVSAYLNENAKSMPLESFFKICCCLGISMDEITGLNKHGDLFGNISLADALEKIIDLDSLCQWEVVETTKEVYYGIQTGNKAIKALLARYRDVKRIGDEELLKIWITKYKEDNKNHLKKYNYHSKEEFEQEYKQYWIKLYDYYVEKVVCDELSSDTMHSEMKKKYDNFTEDVREALDKAAHESPDLDAFKCYMNLSERNL